MDSNSNSVELLTPKLEPTTDTDDNDDIYSINFQRPSRLQWNSENTMKLIELLGAECPELWNPNNPLYKEKMARHSKLEYLADTFGTTTEEIQRKIHNLRSQFNYELRKIKKKQTETGVTPSILWEYFDALSFLKQRGCNEAESLEMSDAVNIELAEFQAKEEDLFGAVRAEMSKASTSASGTSPSRPRAGRVAASAPPPLPPRAQNFMWTEHPRIQPGMNADECQIFGDFVASELRTLRSSESRKKLKRMIQKAILEVGAEEDNANLSRSSWHMD